jgi:hypothetical protein
MKKVIFSIICTLFLGASFAQTLPPLNKYDLETEEGCVDADTVALPLANYLLSVPAIKDEPNRLRAMSFLNKWMDGTPTYTFVLDDDIMDYFREDQDVTDLYMAALTKYQLENRNVKDEKQLSVGALKLLLAYADDEKNFVLVRDGLADLMKAYRNGKLESKL